MKQHYKQFSVFMGFVLVLVLVLGFNVALLAQEKKSHAVKEEQVWAQKGLEYLEKKDYPTALECFQKALNSNPGEINYSINISETYCNMNKFSEALQVLDDTLKQFPDKKKEIQITRADVHYSWAENLTKNYKYHKAISQYEEAYQIDQELRPKESVVELNNIGFLYTALGENEKALAYFEKALPLFSALDEHSGEATTLNNIGLVYNSLGDKQRSLEYFEKALQLNQIVGDGAMEATILNNIGTVYSDLGNKEKALECYEKTLILYRNADDRSGEATTLSNIGLLYDSLGEKEKAMGYYENALPLFSIIGDRVGEAMTLNSIGLLYYSIGEKKKALKYYEKALPLCRAEDDPDGEATTLNNIGMVYSDLGENKKALEYYEKSLQLFCTVGNNSGEADTLANMGAVYYDLGEKEKSLKYYENALPIFRALSNRSREAAILNNIGRVHDNLNENEKALEYYENALPLFRAEGNRSGEAATLTNIGLVYHALGKNKKALEYYENALPLFRAEGNRSGEAATLNNIGNVFFSLDKKKKALEYLENLLPISRSVGDQTGEASTMSNLMFIWERLNNRSLAIFFGKQSVNGLQQLRENIVNLNKDTKSIYLKTKKEFYRYLINLLIMRHRLDEALLVLDMLKAEEYYQFIKNDSASSFPDRQYKPLEFTPFEQQWLDKFNTITSNFTAISNQYHVLLISKPKTESEQTRLAELKKQIDGAIKTYEKYLADLKAAFAQQDRKVQNGEKEGLNLAAQPHSIQSTLCNLDKTEGGKNVSLHYFIYENKIHIILTTPNRQILQSTILDEKALIFMIEKFQVTMNRRKPHSISVIKNPFDKTIIPILINLYNLVFKPIEKDLTSYGATNIMLYLDGDLRNIPFPALYDGRNFLVQRFHISILTTSSMLNIKEEPDQNLKILGMAATKGSKDFRPLNSAKDEIHAIVKDTPHNFNGFIDGKALLDSDFTKPAMFEQLKTASYPLVLITSHFNFALNGENQNFLLMGDESKLTLKEIREADHLFKNVDMLALSACQTAQGSSSGIEIDSFAELAQRSGAKSVVASLWSVNDESTKKLMVAFYRNLNEKRFSSKIEALRQAQLELAGLDDLLQPNSQLKREKTVYASPYYWGPFVMFGNWR